MADNDVEEDSPSETSSLLRRNDTPTYNPTSSLIPLIRSPRFIVITVALGTFVLMFGAVLMITPSLRVYEDIICHHYYDKIEGNGHVALNGNIDEGLCKEPEIQEELAIVMGGLQFADSAPGLIFAYPYGVLADRIGRKRVFGLAITGAILGQIWILVICWFWQNFPLRLIWLSPAFQIIGGGGTVIQSSIYAIISDVSTEANRSSHFFFLAVGSMAAEFFGPSVASAMMQLSPWFPLLAGVPILIMGSFFLIFIPETMPQKHVNGLSEPEEADSGFSPSTSIFSKLKSDFNKIFNTFHANVSVPLILLILTFTLQMESQQSIDLIQRYASKRFLWSIAQTGPLISLRALVNGILLLVILPLLSHALTSSSKSNYLSQISRFNLSNQAKDLILARSSLVLQVVGFALLGLSAFNSTAAGKAGESTFPLALAVAGLIIYTLGMGFSALCRSLITNLVDQQHVARLYAVISVVDTIGALIMAPTLAGLYAWGLRLAGRGEGQGFLGLPFWGLVMFNAVLGGGIMWVKMPKWREDLHDDEDERNDTLEEHLSAN